MPSIFEYLDFRRFLRDFYTEKKRKNPRYSYQVWAHAAGFRSKSYFPELISGKKNIADDAIDTVARSIGLDGKSVAYFEALVAFNQSKTHEQKIRTWAKLTEFNRRSNARLLVRDQHDFYRHWYHHTIRELVVMHDIGNDWERLASLVVPAIKPSQAKASVKLLLRLGLIRKKGKRFELVDTVITSGDEVRSVAVTEFHLQNLDVAKKAITDCPSEARDVSSIVVALSPHGFVTIKEEIQRFRKKLLSIVDSDNAQDRVYHINFQLFPTSKEHDE